MAIELVCGMNSSGKSTYLIDKAIRRANQSKQTIILVPEQYTLETERSILATPERSNGMMNIQVMSITRLISWIFENVQNPNITVLDDIGKTLIIKSILKEHADELTTYEGVASTSGFCGYIGDLIKDLGRFNVTKDDLLNAIDDDMPVVVADKIRDIAKIIDYYSAYSTQQHLVDDNDLIDTLCQMMYEGSPSIREFFHSKTIILDSYDYYPPKNVQLLCAMAQLAEQVSIAITVDSHHSMDMYQAGIDSIDTISTMAESQGIDISYQYCRYAPNISSPTLAHLRGAFHASPTRVYDGECADITISEAIGINEEIESIASNIIGLIVNDDYSFDDITVICSSLSSYRAHIVRIFHQYNIPIFIDDRRSVSSHPAIVFLLGALNFGQSNLRSYLLEMIKTSYTQLDDDMVEVFEDYCIDNNIQGTMFLRGLRRGAKRYDLATINEYRKIAISTISTLNTSAKTTSAWARELLNLVVHNGIEGKLIAQSNRLQEIGSLDAAVETAQTWNVIINIIEQLYAISSASTMSLSDFIELLEECLSTIHIGVLPTSVDSVTIGDIGRSKYTSAKCVFIVGANEGQLPAPLPEGAIFGDLELAILQSRSIVAGRDCDFRKKENTYSLYCAMISSTQLLKISYNGAAGNQPALLIGQLQKIFPSIDERRATINPLSHPSGALSLSAHALGAIGDQRPVPDGMWKKALGSLIHHDKYRSIVDKMYCFASGDDSYRGVLVSDRDMITSVSQLESYARCPFAYMISYGLIPTQDPSATIESTSSGAFLHKLMEDFGTELSSMDVANTSDEQLDILMQSKAKHLAAVFDDGIFMVDDRSQFLADQLIQTARRSGQIYIKNLRRSDFVPIAHELTFDIGREYGPIQIDLPDGRSALLKGKIDRVDELTLGDHRWLRAIDYKSGKMSIDLTGLVAGDSIQLFTYMNALNSSQSSMCAGVFYYPLRNDYTNIDDDRTDSERMQGWFADNSDIMHAMDTSIDAGDKSEIISLSYKKDNTPNMRNTSIKESAFLDAALTLSKDTATQLCSQIYSGNMAPCPLVDANSSSCKYCQYNNICRHGAQTNQRRQRPSVAVAQEHIHSRIEGDDSHEMD